MAMAPGSVTPELPPAPRPRYRQERTLVRRLLRLPGERKQDFRAKVGQLRRAFQDFNADVAGICQWAIRFRPKDRQPAQPENEFWRFFLEPEAFVSQNDTPTPDFRRLEAFDAATEIDAPRALPDPPFTSALRDSIQDAASTPKSKEGKKLIDRLKNYSRPHRMIVVKAAAEWIHARYQRVYQNWLRHYSEWEKEKQQWEQSHPELTPDIRNAFNEMFRKLGVKEKRVRICTAARLSQNKDNCLHAGERAPGTQKRHSQLCNKFEEFQKRELRGKGKKYFFRNAENYLRGGLCSVPHKARPVFGENWQKYLRHMNLTEKTLREKHRGQLPHCENVEQECQFNPHTDLCRRYKELLDERPYLSKHDELYRKWRAEYLYGPRKPVFRYPSARLRSTPKIFGENYFRADFQKSIVGLRLDSMPPGQYLEFAFDPWPKDYQPQPDQTTISSVQLHFVGTRPRIGFRFRVTHQPSRFACTQEELEELRSRKFPRPAQDQDFLEAARKRLLESFQARPEQELRLLAVDLGTSSACAAFFTGQKYKQTYRLKILKMDKLYDQPPKPKQDRSVAGKDDGNKKRRYRPGLTKDHVGRHLETMSKKVAEIAKRRNQPSNKSTPAVPAKSGAKKANLKPFDLRGLAGHSARMIRDWARVNARQIMQCAEQEKADLIVLESLRGFRPPGYDNPDLDKKRRVAFFAHGRIRRKLTEKAVERGMRVVTVPYMSSSKVCACCGRLQNNESRWKKNKRKGCFACEYQACGFQAHADENAARVLGRVFWGEIALPTTKPDHS